MTTPKRKRQTISIEIKKQIIDAAAADPKKSYADLATEFSNNQLTLTSENMKRVFRDKDKILNAIDDGIGAKRARLTTGRHADLEAAVLTWLRQVRSENVAVTALFDISTPRYKHRIFWPQGGAYIEVLLYTNFPFIQYPHLCKFIT